MNLSFHIAKRYLFSKKSHHAINLISAVSVCGIALATMALVCTLSVFNGFEELVATLFTTFDPELKITAAKGKVFDGQDERIAALRTMPDVEVLTGTIEENAVVRYKGRQAVVVIKGVEDNFRQLTAIDSILYGKGEFRLHDEVVDYGVMGIQLVSLLGSGISFVDPLEVYAPRRGEKVNLANPSAGFTHDYLFSPGVVFAVGQQPYDGSYVIAPIAFARRLFGYEREVSAVELKLRPDADIGRVKEEIRRRLGDGFLVHDRYEQQADVFRIMEIEKWVSYLFLTFIVVIACFNVIGSLSMLILDKKEDVRTLRALGADDRLIRRIFLFEGRMIAFFGAVAGMAAGLLLCWGQQQFGFLSLGSSADSFVVESYPVSVHWQDVAGVGLTVLTVGSLAVWYPVRYLSRRLLTG